MVQPLDSPMLALLEAGGNLPLPVDVSLDLGEGMVAGQGLEVGGETAGARRAVSSWHHCAHQRSHHKSWLAMASGSQRTVEVVVAAKALGPEVVHAHRRAAGPADTSFSAFHPVQQHAYEDRQHVLAQTPALVRKLV